MFAVYIRNWKDNSGTMHTENWDLMFSIPQSGDFPVTNPTIKNDQVSAESFSFSMDFNSPYYDSLIPFKTLIQVMYENDCIFFGRVLSINTSTLFATKAVTCEGAMAFMNDTYYEGKQEKKLQKITTESYFQKLIDNHNANTTESWKKIYKGNITMDSWVVNDNQIHEPTSWSDTFSCLKTLTSNYGGHMRVRLHTDGYLYLDWYENYLRDLQGNARCSVQVAKNILDISSTSEVDNIFTVVIPTGGTDSKSNTIYLEGYKYTDKSGVQHTHNSKFFPVGLVCDLYSDAELNEDFHDAEEYRTAESNFGKIFKTQSFSNADTQEKLWTYTKDWVKKNYFGLLTSFSVKAIDMKFLGEGANHILVGDIVNIIYPIVEDGVKHWKTRSLVCKSIQFDLFNPENDTYEFGTPSDLISYEYGKGNKKSGKGGGGGGGGNTKSTAETIEDGDEVNFETIHDMVLEFRDTRFGGSTAANSFWENGEISGTVMCYPSNVDPVHNPEAVFTAQQVGKLTGADGKTYIIAMEPTRGIFVCDGDNTSLKKVIGYYTQKKDLTHKAATPIQTDVKNGTVTFFETVANKVTEKKTAVMDTLNKWFSFWGGQNSDKEVVKVDAKNSKVNIAKQDGSGTIELDGQEGTASIGVEGSVITINKPVEFDDGTGGTQTSTYNVASNGLLKSQWLNSDMAVFKTVIAGSVTALAKDGQFGSGWVTASDFRYGAAGAQMVTSHLQDCFKNAEYDPETNVINFVRATEEDDVPVDLSDLDDGDCYNDFNLISTYDGDGRPVLGVTMISKDGLHSKTLYVYKNI